MSARAKQLGRLLALREAEERVREAEFARAQRAVFKTKNEIETVSQVRSTALVVAQHRLSNGDREGWWVELSTGTVLERTQEELQEVLEARTADASQARGVLERSRVQSEQVRLLHETALKHERIEEDRRQQNISDDRFAARVHWARSVKEV